LQRREVLKLLAVGSSLPFLPSPLLAAARKIHAGLSDVPELKVLSPHQDATVIAMAELIIPATDTPGAKDARVNEFIDRILTDWFSAEERTRFLAGLADLDVRAQALFQKNFVDAAPFQQSQILRALGEEMAQATAALAAGPRGYRGSAPEPDDNFYFTFRDLTLTGYFTSEAGFTEQLHEEIIPGRFDGCVPSPPVSPAKGT
jgi:hypothetical protein